MINRLVPAGITVFCAKKKQVIGEISRVKDFENSEQNSLEKTPDKDIFVSVNQNNTASNSMNKQISHGCNGSSDIIKEEKTLTSDNNVVPLLIK